MVRPLCVRGELVSLRSGRLLLLGTPFGGKTTGTSWTHFVWLIGGVSVRVRYPVVEGRESDPSLKVPSPKTTRLPVNLLLCFSYPPLPSLFSSSTFYLF